MILTVTHESTTATAIGKGNRILEHQSSADPLLQQVEKHFLDARMSWTTGVDVADCNTSQHLWETFAIFCLIHERALIVSNSCFLITVENDLGIRLIGKVNFWVEPSTKVL